MAKETRFLKIYRDEPLAIAFLDEKGDPQHCYCLSAKDLEKIIKNYFDEMFKVPKN